MSQLHITRELWRKLARRELKPTELVELGLHHFFALCPTCKAAIPGALEESTHFAR